MPFSHFFELQEQSLGTTFLPSGAKAHQIRKRLRHDLSRALIQSTYALLKSCPDTKQKDTFHEPLSRDSRSLTIYLVSGRFTSPNLLIAGAGVCGFVSEKRDKS
jgi:hypothetical protein